MLSIRKSTFIRFDNGKSVERLELALDSAADLPAAENGTVIIDGRVAAQGSIAWDISTGDFYGLNSSGEWINQNGTGTYSASASQSLSVSDINRYVMQPISDTNEIIPDNESEVIEIEPEPVRDLESR